MEQPRTTALDLLVGRAKILTEISDERNYQVGRWGNDFDDTHTPADWWTFVSLYYARALQGWKNPGTTVPAGFRDGLIKVAAIVVAWIEALDRKAAADDNLPF